MRRRLAVFVPFLVLALSVPATAAPPPIEEERVRLARYAADTWQSFVAMTDEDSGLPADALSVEGERSVQTSTTNIGAYMWSTVVAEELGFIDEAEAVARLEQTLSTLETMERHEPSGQYFNWYDHRTGEVLTVWPPTGEPLTPHLSSVDNGWLATALLIVRNTVPALYERAGALFDSMDFGFYYQPEVNRILFHYAPSTGDAPCCYDTLVSESRIATYLGIAKGEIPPKAYFGTWRTFPDTCDWSWQETKPVGEWRSYLGVDVFEGAYPYRDMLVLGGWGGSAFESHMPPLFVPEEEWGPRSWGVNHPRVARSQIIHGLQEAQYGYWGFSPANVPEGGYQEYGVDAIGLNPEGYASNTDRTYVDYGFPGCPGREPGPVPPPEAYTNGVVTPHAVFIALRWTPRAALRNLARLEADFEGLYTEWGFRDSVNVDTGVVSDFYLALDQGMIMAALGNGLADDVLRRAFASDEVVSALRPLLGIEEFISAPHHCTITGTTGDDVLRGTAGDDVICARAGNDTVHAGGGDDVVYGSSGHDVISGGPGSDTVYGGWGRDRVQGDGGTDTLFAGKGDDQVWGGPGDDDLSGGEGDDDVRGNMGEDQAAGGPGLDTIYGDRGDDLLRGGDDDDLLHGSQGDDHHDGGNGEDSCNGAAGTDTAERCEVLLNMP